MMIKNTMNNKVLVKPYEKLGEMGLDIEICDKTATVSDFCRVLDDYILKGDLARKRSDAASCEGCDICCMERMPLTSVDAYMIMKITGTDIKEFFRRYAYVAVSGRAVDITLSRDYEDKCLFLHKTSGRCQHYQYRPFVCRTYICTPLSPRAARLRKAIVNSGEDELVRLWIDAQNGGELLFHEGEMPDIRASDWPLNSWSGKMEYSQILLAEILSPSLWSECCKKGKDIV